MKLDRYRVADGVHLAQAALSVDPSTGAITNDQLDRARADLLKAAPKPVAVAAKMPAPAVEPAPDDEPSAEGPPDETEPAMVAREPEPVVAEDYAEPDSSDGPDALTITGYIAGGLGLVAHAVSWITYAQLSSAQSDYTAALNANPMPSDATAEELTAVRDLDSLDDPPIIFGVTGAALSTVALPMWLPKTEGIEWWGWASGGAGLALGITGAVLHANASGCELDRYQRCTEPALATDLGPMLLLQAVPLLAVPVVQGVRSLTEDRASMSLRLGDQSASIHLEGQW